MIEPSNEIARRAAERLAGMDTGLPMATERLLQGAPRRRSLDVVVGGLRAGGHPGPASALGPRLPARRARL